MYYNIFYNPGFIVYPDDSTVGIITINNGTITGFGTGDGAGIGDGQKGSGCHVVITGGTVKASGNNSADIGGGAGIGEIARYG